MSFLLFIKTILFKKNNVLMFESSPDLSSNTYPVFLELLKRGYNKKYFFIWKIRKYKKYPKIKNVFYWLEGKKYGFFTKAFFHLLFKRIKANICCNGFLLPRNNNQVSFYLTHGTFVKNVANYYNIPKTMSYVLVASDAAGKIISKTTKFPFQDRIVATGYPYNDDLTNASVNISMLFEHKYSKYIVWYPTYKQHKNSADASTTAKAMSIIDNEKNAILINNELLKTNSLLIVKPHFAQDLTKVKNYNLSNILFISDDFFFEHNITSYAFIAACDALITDYSAIYFDYLICGKPIGAVWEDIDEYKKFPGFSVDIDEVMKGAVKIYNADDFISFVNDVVNGNDGLKSTREDLCNIYNFAKDGKNSERVANFIIEKCGFKL